MFYCFFIVFPFLALRIDLKLINGPYLTHVEGKYTILEGIITSDKDIKLSKYDFDFQLISGDLVIASVIDYNKINYQKLQPGKFRFKVLGRPYRTGTYCLSVKNGESIIRSENVTITTISEFDIFSIIDTCTYAKMIFIQYYLHCLHSTGLILEQKFLCTCNISSYGVYFRC